MTIEHRDIQTGEQHVVANWVVSSVNALTSLTPNELDIGKQAWVAGRGHYVLAAVSPNVWELVAPTVASAAFDADTRVLTLTLTDSTTITVTVPPGVDTAGVNALIAAALEDYYTASEIDGQFTALSEAINTALSGKEPTIAAGTSSQYWRGDKTWQALNTAAVAESADFRYLSDAQKARVQNAANTSTDGYLTSTDWNTFNNKQAALADVITANTYGSSTQYPIVTVSAKGIVTGITLQTVPTPTFTDATFAVQKNGSPSISATWSLTAFTASRVHTYPNKDINFGDMSFIATTNSNNLSGTRTRIVGGSGCTVGGTDNVCIGSTSSLIYGTNNVILGCGALSAYGQPVANYIGTSAVRSALISCYGCDIGDYATDVVLLNAVGVSGASIANGTTLIGGRVASASLPNCVIQGGTFGRPSIRKVESKLYAVFDGTLRTLTENGSATEDYTTLVDAGSGGLTGEAGFAAMHHIRIMGGNGASSKRQVMAERIVWVRRRSIGHNYVIEKTYTPTPDINLDGITLNLQIDLAGTNGTLLRIRAADTSGTHGTAGTILAHVESHYMGI